MFEVTTTTIRGQSSAIGNAGPYTLVFDRPAEAGGGGLGFNGGQLLYLAIAGCVSNDLFRESDAWGIALHEVRITVRGDFSGSPATSDAVSYEVAIEGDADPDRLRELVDHVDAIAEIPNSLRQGTLVSLSSVRVGAAGSPADSDPAPDR